MRMRQTPATGNHLLGLLYLSIVVAILVAAMLAVSAQKGVRNKVILGNQEVVVEIADTSFLRERGLSGHPELTVNEGMLFVFEDLQKHGFWMKDMRFPIDIIWFDQNKKIVDVEERATPQSYPKVFIPHVSSQFVLEVPAGFFSEHRLKIGDIIKIL